MDTIISIIPELRRLHLVNVGPWADTSFEFVPRINIIHGSSGCGKSFILRALVSSSHEYLTARRGSNGGTVTVEYAGSEFRYELPERFARDAEDFASLSQGQKIMRLLHQTLRQTKQGCCICMEADVFGCLDAGNCARAGKMINQTESQFIIVFPNSLKPEIFGSLRVFECRYDLPTESASVQTIDL